MNKERGSQLEDLDHQVITVYRVSDINCVNLWA